MRFFALVAIAAGACNGGRSDVDTLPTAVETSQPPTGGNELVDADGDGYKVPLDCDDANADVHPNHTESCDGIDEDCDGTVDDNAVDGFGGFTDLDQDGFGDATAPLVTCDIGPGSGWSDVGGDCGDTDNTRFPGANESCNALDDDCDQSVDEGAYLLGAQYETIQEAVSNAVDGDVIEICGSLHQEGAIAIDRDVTVASSTGDPALTTIDGSTVAGSVFVVDGGDLTLDGVTVTGGSGTQTVVTDVLVPFTALAGGAINALTGEGGLVTVRRCAFDGNRAGAGGAIAARDLVVVDTSFSRNEAVGLDAGTGGALWIGPGGSLTVEQSVFSDNAAETDGGGMTTYSPSLLVDVEADGNEALMNGGFGLVHTPSLAFPDVPVRIDIEGGNFHDNVSGDNGGAFELVSASGSTDVATSFDGNLAQANGGAVRVTSHGASVTWDGGTFTNNDAFSRGGAIRVEALFAGEIVVDGVTLRDNVAGAGGGGMSAVVTKGDDYSAGTIIVRDSVVLSNATNNFAHGGGIYVISEGGSPEDPVLGTFERVQIEDNFASGAWGGGLYVNNAHLSFTDCGFVDNMDDGGAGAMSIVTSVVEVYGTDFVNNQPNEVVLTHLAEEDVLYTPAAANATFICDSDAVPMTCQ